MAYLSRRPAPPLDRWIDTVWTSDRPAGLEHAREWGLPTGRSDLVVPLDRPALRRFAGADDDLGQWLAGGVLQGAQWAPSLRCTATASVAVGAQFRPAGLAGLFGSPAHEHAGHALALDGLWPGFAASLQARVGEQQALFDAPRRLALFEAALAQRLRTAPCDRLADWAWQNLASGIAVGAVQRASGLSPATFIRRYRAACGLAPKQHAAVMRFQAALRLAGQSVAARVGNDDAPTGWAGIAAAAGYADQAHLSREFSRFAGRPPGQLQRDATGFDNHLRCR